MKTDVTPEQVQQYQEQGFLVIEDFLTPNELDYWRTVTEDAIRLRLEASPTGANIMNNQGDPDAFYAQVFTQCLRLADIHPQMAELMFDEDLGRIAGTLAGVDGIRIWTDQALFKKPYGNFTGFHMDNPFWSFSSPDAISLWMALDDATVENGCLYYFPGTHKEASYELVGIESNLGSLFKQYPQWRERAAVPAPAKAGSAVYHNGLIAHGAGANMTNKPRRAMTCAYMPDGSVFNGQQNILSDNHFKRLKLGELLNDNEWNRLIWHK